MSNITRKKSGFYNEKKRLSNFIATIIVEYIVFYITGDPAYEFKLEVRINGGKPRKIQVTAGEFDSMTWVSSKLGASAMIAPEGNAKVKIKHAIQRYSKNKQLEYIYSQCGMIRHNGKPIFLHANGVLSGNDTSLADKVSCSPIDQFRDIKLPSPRVSDAEVKKALRTCLSILKISDTNHAIGVASLASATRAPIAFFKPCTVVLFIVGKTGAFKSTLAAIIQNFFGTGFSNDNLPGNWKSTTNASELLAKAASGIVVTFDDYVYQPGSSLVNQEEMIEFLIRGVANQSTRLRATSTGTLTNLDTIRSLLLVTGEHCFHNAMDSIHERTVYIPVTSQDFTTDQLTKYERHGRAGQYALGMALFIQEILLKHDNLKEKVEEIAAKYALRAQEALPGRLHKRAAANVSQLMIGLDLFITMCRMKGAISSSKAGKLKKKCFQSLVKLVANQQSIRKNNQPGGAFITAIKTGLNGGIFHICDTKGEQPNSLPEHSSGWLDGVSNGKLLGWVDEDKRQLYLNSNFNWHLLRECAPDNQRNKIPTNQKSFGIALKLLGLLVHRDGNRERNTIRKTLDGEQRIVYAIRADWLFAG